MHRLTFNISNSSKQMRIHSLADTYPTRPDPIEGYTHLSLSAIRATRSHLLGASVGDSTHEVDTILLHLLVPVLEDRREARQQVLDGRGHLGHADHVHNRLQGAEDAAQHLGVLAAHIHIHTMYTEAD